MQLALAPHVLQVARQLMLAILMDEVLEMMSKVYRRTVTQEEAASWSLDSWMNEHFPVGISIACPVLTKQCCLGYDLFPQAFWHAALSRIKQLPQVFVAVWLRKGLAGSVGRPCVRATLQARACTHLSRRYPCKSSPWLP